MSSLNPVFIHRRGRGLLLAGLVGSVLWLTGCSSSSYFVYRDSHRHSRGHSHHYYERWHHSHGHGHGYYRRDRDCRW